MSPTRAFATAPSLSSAVAVAWLAVNAACIRGEQPLDSARPNVPAAEFVATALTPIWRAREIREPIFFIEGQDSAPPTGRLLFKPTSVLSVTSGTRDTIFEPGRDFDVDLAAGTITIPPGSRIPVTTREHLYPLMTSNLPKIARKRGDRTRGIFFDEGSAYHRLQTEVTYRVEPGQWMGPTPKFAGHTLPKTLAKLRGKQPLTLVLCGDSISAGSNASLFTKAPPHCPPFGPLTALALASHYDGKVEFRNLPVDGTTSKDGLQLAKDHRIGMQSPDLVIIAYGMNDAYYQRDVVEYKANIRGMMQAIRADAPNAEFILVAPMLANAERGIPLDKFPQYRDALADLCGPGVALADVTSIWTELLKRKTFYDLTGNGVNHPNDFGHCVYAQTILAVLVAGPNQPKRMRELH